MQYSGESVQWIIEIVACTNDAVEVIHLVYVNSPLLLISLLFFTPICHQFFECFHSQFFIWTIKNCRFHFICLHLYAKISIHKMVFISSAACLFPSSSSFLIPKDLAMLLEEQLWIGFSSVCLGIKYVVCVCGYIKCKTRQISSTLFYYCVNHLNWTHAMFLCFMSF